MTTDLLKIENLSVRLGQKTILQHINFNIRKGEIHALLGPNGSGKTTLSQVLMGLPPYKISQGAIYFQGQNITRLAPEKRAHLGIGLVFQNPPAIKGVVLKNLIDQISSSPKQPQELFQDKTIANLLDREINVGFSGGEKKISELYQLIYLNPQLIILDEIDSGLDIERLKQIISFIKNNHFFKQKSFLVITHREDILKYFNPSMTHILIEGQIVCSSKNWRIPWKTINQYGYEKCKICYKKVC
ncbi:MAG: Fe-S cluster assembly ATPase SufC [Minisyncoccia bacterium]